MSEATQRVGPLVAVPTLLRELGCDPSAVLVGTGLDATRLDGPDNEISYAAAGRLLARCARDSGCAHFGLLMGQRWNLEGLGLPGRLCLRAPTVGLGVLQFARLQHINSRGAVIFISNRDGEAAIHYAIYAPGVQGADQIQAAAMAVAWNALRSLCGPEWLPSEVQFAFRKPADVRPYQRWFQVPLRFNSPQTALQFPAHWLERPSLEADIEEYKLLCAAAEAIEPPAVSDSVRRLLRSLIPDAAVSGDRIAESLPMNRRTLSRKLKGQGATFQQLLDEIRFEIARQMLRDTDLAAVDIGVMLDYADASAFVRAFRRWSGTTPARWRQETRVRT